MYACDYSDSEDSLSELEDCGGTIAAEPVHADDFVQQFFLTRSDLLGQHLWLYRENAAQLAQCMTTVQIMHTITSILRFRCNDTVKLLRDDQRYAIREGFRRRCCVFEWPTGSGKTRIMLGFISALQTLKLQMTPFKRIAKCLNEENPNERERLVERFVSEYSDMSAFSLPVLIVTNASLVNQTKAFLFEELIAGRYTDVDNVLLSIRSIRDDPNKELLIKKVVKIAMVGGVCLISKELFRKTKTEHQDETSALIDTLRTIHWGCVFIDEVHTGATEGQYLLGAMQLVAAGVFGTHGNENADSAFTRVRFFFGFSATVSGTLAPVTSRILDVFRHNVVKCPMSYFLHTVPVLKQPNFIRVIFETESVCRRSLRRYMTYDRIRLLATLLEYHRSMDHSVIVFCRSVKLLVALSVLFRCPMIYGDLDVNSNERRAIIASFRAGTIKTIFMSAVGVEGLDFPATNVAIQFQTNTINVSSQLVQKLGRIMRYHQGLEAFFYDLELYSRLGKNVTPEIYNSVEVRGFFVH